MATGRLPDPNTAPLTAKGDIYTYSTVPARLAVGSDGDSLIADSSATTGLRYSGGINTGNPILNSDFSIWQRGTSLSITDWGYTADRWLVYRGGANVTAVSRQSTGDTTNLPNIQYCARVGRTSGHTTTSSIYLGHSLETINSIPFVGKTVTVSFYARKGANFSSGSSILTAGLDTGTGTDQNNILSYSGYSATTAFFTLTTSWQRFTFTGTISTSANEIGLRIYYVPEGTAGAADYFEITGVQIDIGNVALPYRRTTSTFASELMACQRYYWRQTNFQAAGGTQSGYDNNVWFSLQTFNPIPMRTQPTAAIESSPYVADFASNLRTVISVNVITKYAVGFAYDSTKLTTAYSYGLNFNDAGRALSFSAEL